MADDKTLTENDDEPIVVEVDQLPEPGADPKPAASDTDDEDGDEEHGEDTRLAESEDDDEDDSPPLGEDSRARKRRLNRRKARQAFIDRTLAELADHRAWRAKIEPQLANLHSTTIDTSEAQVDARLSEARREKDMSERILAKAIESGNGEDAAAALKLRDDATTLEQSLTKLKDGFAEARKPRTDAADPQIAALASRWKADNAGWYGVNTAATQLANQIDAQVKADGYNPTTPAYFQELTRRVSAAFKPATSANGDDKPNGARRKAPPQGRSTEYAPASTRREVYLTPDRKQAIVDAGAWDDPKERARFIRAYEKYDREQSAGR